MFKRCVHLECLVPTPEWLASGEVTKWLEVMSYVTWHKAMRFTGRVNQMATEKKRSELYKHPAQRRIS